MSDTTTIVCDQCGAPVYIYFVAGPNLCAKCDPPPVEPQPPTLKDRLQGFKALNKQIEKMGDPSDG